jgi:flagellar biosynthesis/type III secretory pathway ATPase
MRIQGEIRRFAPVLMLHPDHRELIERANRAGVDFLFTDIEMAFTFIRVGETRESRDRSFGKALKGYHAVSHFMSRVMLSPSQRTELEEKLHKLKSRLEQAGFSCEN